MNIKTFVLQAVAMIAVSVITVGSYHFTMGKTADIRTIDLTDVLTTIQAKYAKQLESKELTADDRKKMGEELEGFGAKIQSVIKDFSQSCACVIVVRQAVVNDTATDITGIIKARMGL